MCLCSFYDIEYIKKSGVWGALMVVLAQHLDKKVLVFNVPMSSVILKLSL